VREAPAITPRQALDRAAASGIHRLRIPTPFAVGRVNCYLLEGRPLTLVDAGPNSGKSLDELERQLAELGHEIGDIGLVIVTHQHIDHFAAWSPSSPPAPGLRSRRSTSSRPSSSATTPTPTARTSSPAS
jgi:ribonuclease BN (tRNA processing enzyme)